MNKFGNIAVITITIPHRKKKIIMTRKLIDQYTINEIIPWLDNSK